MRSAVIALLLSGTLCVLAVAVPTPTASLAGHWLFNSKKSDDAR
jgi:hypothetical protein